jgi:hydroxymethylpyrimidine pyrophosphatase-like HAD family hydrolase
MRLKYKIIAIDFDGTIVDDQFPHVGEFKPFSLATMWDIKKHGGKIIIWTCRTGEQLEQAKQALMYAGVKYDALNQNLQETIDVYPDNGRKIYADVYIDDRANFIEKIDWCWIHDQLFDKGE